MPIQRVVAGMSLSDLQIYVCQRWEEMFKVNVLAINTYVRKLEELEELDVDTKQRSVSTCLVPWHQGRFA